MRLPLVESVMLPPRPPLHEPAVWFEVIRAPLAPLPCTTMLPVASMLMVAPIPFAVVDVAADAPAAGHCGQVHSQAPGDVQREGIAPEARPARGCSPRR